MKTTLKYALMTATLMVFVTVTAPAQADPTVMCSVRASYQPAVDVNGKPVTPADVRPVAPQSIRIPLTIDLAQRMNEVLPDGMKLEPQVGTVEIRGDGHVIINGKDMTGPADALCATVAKQKAAAMKTKDAPKKKRVVNRAADVPANIDEPVPAQPAAPVESAEPLAAAPAESVEPAIVAEPAAVAPEAPQVMDIPASPDPVQQGQVVPSDGVLVAPPPGPAASTPASPEAPSPRVPEDVVMPGDSPEMPAPPPADETLPVPPQDGAGDGMLSGGAQ